ncbi:hypothetical protein [Rufibacter sp. LB8]|uniref:hypothetical protein n=1 Tax=Rufibacter sp. LB8 TaxID=2777781 RepID=UPI00178C2804|nr:hypothetical protein [Rufibacter sp. LB8]
MGRSSSKSSLQFWLLLAASVVLSAMVISLFLKVVKVMIYLLLVLVLVPIIYLALKKAVATFRNPNTKLKTRD